MEYCAILKIASSLEDCRLQELSCFSKPKVPREALGKSKVNIVFFIAIICRQF